MAEKEAKMVSKVTSLIIKKIYIITRLERRNDKAMLGNSWFKTKQLFPY